MVSKKLKRKTIILACVLTIAAVYTFYVAMQVKIISHPHHFGEMDTGTFYVLKDSDEETNLNVKKANLKAKENDLQVEETNIKMKETSVKDDLGMKETNLKVEETSIKMKETSNLKTKENNLKVKEADLKVKETDLKEDAPDHRWEDDGRVLENVLCPSRDKQPEKWPLLHYQNNTQLEQNFRNSGLTGGGLWVCHNVRNQQRPPVAVIVPYRQREENLRDFLGYMIPYLQDTGASFQIFVIDQHGPAAFNRAALLNVGFLEALKVNNKFECFIFHDVDKVPMENLNYTCSSLPTPMYKRLYREDPKTGERSLRKPGFYGMFVGGVLAMPRHVFQTINGCTNLMHGWGGEDDNLYSRFRFAKFSLHQMENGNGTYLDLSHRKDLTNPSAHRSVPLCQQMAKLRDFDGLTTVQYNLKMVQKFPLYTHVTVELPGPSDASDYQPYLDRKLKDIIDNITDSNYRQEMRTLFSKYVPLLNSTSPLS